MTPEDTQYVLDVLLQTRAIVVRGAGEGFNPEPESGDDWAMHLFLNNGALSNAIRLLEKRITDV